MDFSYFEKLNQRRFIKMTKIGHKQRRLVIYPGFKNFISRIVDGQSLQRSFEQIHFFDNDFTFNSDECYAFIIPPEIPVIRHIMWCKENTESNPMVELWFQPRINEIVTAFLVDSNFAPEAILSKFPTEENSALKNGQTPVENLFIYNLELDVVPLDNDVLTINSPFSFMRAWTMNDLTVVSEFRKALDVISNYIGFASISAIGNLSTSIAKTVPTPTSTNTTHLILIDRSTDLITPLITQMNYEGLIAEFLGIDCGVTSVENESGKKQLQILSSQIDKLFGYIRSMNHTEVSAEIESRTSQVSEKFSKKASNADETVSLFRETAQAALENQTLVDHINITTKVLNMMKQSRFFRRMMNSEADALSGTFDLNGLYKEMLEYGEDFRRVIRMLCLESLLRGGVQDYPKLINFIVFNYGFQMVPYLLRLQEAGLFGQSGPKWSPFVKNFQLFVSNYEELNDQAAYCYLGYAPLSVRYVQRIIGGEFAAVNKAVTEILQQECLQIGKVSNNLEGDFLICFVGGCTHSELNCFRRLQERDVGYQNKHFQVMTTDMMSSNDFFDHIAYQIPGWSPTV